MKHTRFGLQSKFFGPFTKEIHKQDCECSICAIVGNRFWPFGILYPDQKDWNSWWWFYYSYGSIPFETFYIRWQGFWKKNPFRH